MVDFQRDGPLPSDHVFIIKWVDESIAHTVAHLQSLFISVIINAFHQTDLGPKRFRRFDLGDRS